MSTNTNNTTIKTPENLTWDGLYERYPNMTALVDGKPVTIDTLPTAIEDGTLLKEINEAADAMGVETDALLSRMMRNMSSQKTNINKRYDSPSKTKDLKRVELLMDFIRTARGGIKKTAGKKSYWEYTEEEILTIPLTDVRLLKSIRDNKASKLSKFPEDLPDWFDDSYVAACKRYSEANAQAKHGTVQVELDASALALVQKVEDGANLSKKDKAQLAALLRKLTTK